MAQLLNALSLTDGCTQLKLFALHPPPCLDVKHQNASAHPSSFDSPHFRPAYSSTFANPQAADAPSAPSESPLDLYTKFKHICNSDFSSATDSAFGALPVANVNTAAEEQHEIPYLPSAASTNWYFSSGDSVGYWRCSACRCSVRSAQCSSLFTALLQCDYLRLVRGQLPAPPIMWPEEGTAVDEIPSWGTQIQHKDARHRCILCKAPTGSWVLVEMPALAKFFVACAVQPCMTAAGLSQRWAPWRGMAWEGPTPNQLEAIFAVPLTLGNCVARLTAALQLATQWAKTAASTTTPADSDATILSKFLNFCCMQDTLAMLRSEFGRAESAADIEDTSSVSTTSSSIPRRSGKRTRERSFPPPSALANSSNKRTAGLQPAVQYREEPAPRRILSKVQAAAELQTLPAPVRRLMRYDWRSGEWVARAKTSLGELEVNGTSAFMAALTRDYVRAVELNVQPHMMERQRKHWLVLQSEELQNAFVDVQGPTDAMDIRLKLTWKGPNPDEIGAQCERMPQHDFVNMDNWAEITKAAVAQRIQYHRMLHFPSNPSWAATMPVDGYEAAAEDDSDAESLQSLSEPHIAAQAADIAAAAERDADWQQASDGSIVQPVTAAAFLLCGIVDGSDDEGGGPPSDADEPSLQEAAGSAPSTALGSAAGQDGVDAMKQSAGSSSPVQLNESQGV